MSRLPLIIALLLAAAPAAAAPGRNQDNIADLIVAARSMNPEVATMTLEADAAEARAQTKGWLDDPKFEAQVQLFRDVPSYAPGTNQALVTYRVRQMLPWWGKLSLQREQSELLSKATRARQHGVENEVAYRVKEAYAQYHLAHLAADETRNLIGIVDLTARIAQARYAQTVGGQEAITGANAERAAMQSELARIQAEQRRAKVRLNGLLGRKPTSPLAEDPMPRAIPPAETLDLETLLERALTANPGLREQGAQIEAADKGRELADKEWFPDIEVSLGVMQREQDIEGYEAMIGVTIPLQRDKRHAMVREASAMSNASRARLTQLRAEITTDLHQAHAELEALAARKKLLRGTTLPQARIALDSAVKAYQLSRAEFASVLTAEQALRRAIVEWLTVQYDEQVRLADIERLIGGEL
jgi:outer membrane protein TolC